MQIDIQCRGGSITPSLREWTHRRILFAIGQFGTHIRAVRASLSDENGPKGGVDQRCLMEARLARTGTVVAEVQDPDLYAAISRAADRLSRRVRTALDREKTARKTPARRSPARRKGATR